MEDKVEIFQGDAIKILKHHLDDSVDSVVTDPPYNLSFMGKNWDSNDNFELWCQQWAEECYRVLKPGGHLLSFGGTRTSHRMVCGIEDAGFEIRDSIAWLYGSGFPKSMDVSKAIDKAAGAERVPSGAPTSLACEFVRRGISCQGHAGETATSQSGLTVHALPTAPATDDARRWSGWGTALKPAHEPIVVARKPLVGTVAKNVLAHGTGAINVDGCRVEMSDGDREKYIKGDEAWRQMNERRAKGRKDNDIYGEYGIVNSTPKDGGRWPTNVLLDEGVAIKLEDKFRYFPVFKYHTKASGKERPKVDGVSHPTVKPLGLLRWLVRLVTPPGGVVLDPFAGSGTTGEAAILEGMKCLLIEREADYIPLIEKRLGLVKDD